MLLRRRGSSSATASTSSAAIRAKAKFEDFLRGVVAKFPRPNLVRGRLRRFVAAVNCQEAGIRALDDAELPVRFRAACRDMRARGFDDELVARAFAVVREASRRMLGMRHHDVQLIGGWALLQGRVAEMATGEGKTLVATLAACTAARRGRGGARGHGQRLPRRARRRRATCRSTRCFGCRSASISAGHEARASGARSTPATSSTSPTRKWCSTT